MAKTKATATTKDKKTEPVKTEKVVAVSIVENGIASRGNIDAIKNRELRATANKLYNLSVGAKKNLMAIGCLLATVDDTKEYEKGGYADVFEFARAVIGYKKPMVYNLMQVARKFLIAERNDKGVLTNIHSEYIDDNGNDFSVSQLQEMKALETDDVTKLVNAGAVKPSMTVKDVRKTVNEFKNGVLTIDENGNVVMNEPEKTENESEETPATDEEVDASAMAVLDMLNAIDILLNDERISATSRAALVNVKNTVDNIAKTDLQLN